MCIGFCFENLHLEFQLELFRCNDVSLNNSCIWCRKLCTCNNFEDRSRGLSWLPCLPSNLYEVSVLQWGFEEFNSSRGEVFLFLLLLIDNTKLIWASLGIFKVLSLVWKLLMSLCRKRMKLTSWLCWKQSNQLQGCTFLTKQILH